MGKSDEAAAAQAEKEAAEAAAAAQAEKEAAEAAAAAQAVHLPSLRRILVGKIEARNVDHLREDLMTELEDDHGAVFDLNDDRGGTLTMADISVTAHYGPGFLLNYWAAQARQALLQGEAA